MDRQSASATPVPDPRLACSVCHNVVTDPATPNSGHTVCHSCLKDRKTDSATQMKPSSPSQDPGNTAKSTEDRNCCLCGFKDQSSPAIKMCCTCNEALCRDCLSKHTTDAKSRHHKMLDLSEAQASNPRREEHAKVMPSMETMQSYILDRHAKITEKIDITQKSITQQKSIVNKIARNKNKSQAEINNAFKKLIGIVRQKELALLEQLESITDQEHTVLEDELAREEAGLQMAQQQLQFITNLRSVDDTVNMYQYVASGQAALDRGEGQASSDKILDITFSQKTSGIIEELKHMNFGSLQLHETEHATGNEPANSRQMADIDAKVTSDAREPNLYGITVVVVDGIRVLVVTDQENKCAKAFYTRNNKPCHNKLSLDDVPNDIVYLPEDKVIIPSTWSRQLITLKVTPELEFVSSVVTGKGYHSLAVLNATTLAASSGLFQCVDILDMSGNLMRSIGGMESRSNIFVNPWYMCASNGRLLISDRGRKTVFCMTSEGEVLWTYAATGNRTLLMPSGVATSGSGSVFVADRDGSKVFELNESGQFVREVPASKTGIGEPCGVCAHDSSLFVCGDGRIQRMLVDM